MPVPEERDLALTKTEGSAKRKASAAPRKMHRKAQETARDQFAALGLFIQNFEYVVRDLRDHCAMIVQGRNRGVSGGDPKVFLISRSIASLVFHSEVMTARPLLEVWRALMSEECRALTMLSKLSEKGNETALSIAKEVGKEFTALYETRNQIIHASWSIGRWLREEDIKSVLVEKWKVVASRGFEKRDDLPKTFDELMDLGRKAGKLSSKLGRLIQFIHYHPESIEHVFLKVDGEWVFVPPVPSPIRKLKSSLRK